MKLSELMTKRLDGYNGTNAKHKSDFHRLAKRQLKSLAMALMLPPGSYEVRDNRGGMAVSGECTLHTNTFYCQIAQSHMGQGSEVMYRSCKGRKDYTGGANHFAPAYVLDDPHAFALELRRIGRFGFLLADEKLTWASHASL